MAVHPRTIGGVKHLVVAAVLGVGLIGGLAACGGDDDDDDPAAAASAEVCDARSDLSEEVDDFVASVKAVNLGDAREDLADVTDALRELGSAVAGLATAQRDAVQPQVDAISSAIGSIDEGGLGSLGATVDTIGAEVSDALDAIASNSALDCS